MASRGFRPLPERIRQLRKELGNISQAALAARIGVTPNAVASWEQGVREPQAINCLRLAALTGGENARFFFARSGGQPPKTAAGPQTLEARLQLLEDRMARGFARMEELLLALAAEPATMGVRVKKPIRIRRQPHEKDRTAKV